MIPTPKMRYPQKEQTNQILIHFHWHKIIFNLRILRIIIQSHQQQESIIQLNKNYLWKNQVAIPNIIVKHNRMKVQIIIKTLPYIMNILPNNLHILSKIKLSREGVNRYNPCCKIARQINSIKQPYLSLHFKITLENKQIYLITHLMSIK